MTFQTLEKISITELLEVFNLSFSDYHVPFHLTKEQLQSKIKSENIKLELSAGAFENDTLVGFILHGYDEINGIPTAYNGGTGVVPASRGKNITAKLYGHIIPVLSQRGIKKVQLEVITGNKAAIKVYQNTGFTIGRILNCYKGPVVSKNHNHSFIIRELKEYNWEQFQSFWEWAPSWQNSISAVEKLKHTNILKGIYKNDVFAGYIIYNPLTKRIQQYAVDKNYRGKGAGRLLFESIAQLNNNEVILINTDEGAKDTQAFLTKIGLQIFITQYEMELALNT